MSALDEAKRKIAIDTHLKRYDAAVTRLSASGDYEAAIVIFSRALVSHLALFRTLFAFLRCNIVTIGDFCAP